MRDFSLAQADPTPMDLQPAASPSARPGVRTWAGKRPGRSHVRLGTPCQDAFAVHHDAASGRVAAAVADGLGSRPLSHLGSQAACDAAVASLAAEPAAPGAWDEAALRRAFHAARAAVAAAAAERGLATEDLATTLQLAGLEPAGGEGGGQAGGQGQGGGRAVGAIVGDGAIVAAAGGKAELLLEPAPSPYANLVVPLTADEWEDSFRYAEREASTVLLFSDGLTRLLLTKSRDGWALFPPFFDAFLPQVAAPGAPADLVDRFLGGDAVDRSWDDDKGLVVLHAPQPVRRTGEEGEEVA